MAGNGAAEDLVDEFKTLAALERLDAEVDLAELARPAGLLLVAVMALGVGGDRFAVGDLGRLGVHVDAAVLQLLQDQAQVQLAQAVDDHLVGLAVLVPFEGGVFLGQLGRARRRSSARRRAPWA